MDLILRHAAPDDADSVSRVILSALHETNAHDYTPDVIARVGRSFSPEAVLRLFAVRQVFVAVMGDGIVGTASLDGATIRSVFVDPALQGQRIGTRLVKQVEDFARAQGVTLLTVPASVTAESFYAGLGFMAVRDVHHGDERTIVMELTIRP